LTQRRAEVQQALPELERIAELPAASDDDKGALRSARAALALIGHELQHLQGEYWIAVLEEFGILPNYTLLDDGVVLDVSLTWIDPETQEFRSEPASYLRSSANALREFAPGATFYVRGLEILVDAVDLGPEDAAIQAMGFCPACGYSTYLGVAGQQNTVPACPRCGSPGLAGSEHHLDVVELARVSAEMRRDEAVITDRSDERTRERFSIAVAADIDPAHVAKQWYLSDFDFGTKYLERMQIRWVNLGRAGPHGTPRVIGGNSELAPLFRVCEGCGVLDRTARAGRASDHRAWCRYRGAHDQHIRSVALTRTLTTQGAVIRLPVAVTLGDRFAIPSLAAALLLGLHEQIGGSPDHIDVAHIAEPAPGGGGATSEALLLHDIVPGGTGYLAELADAERVWDLLRRAWERVSRCECQTEQRLACHRCLLPFARPWQVDSVSRATAERHLRAILTAGTADTAPAAEMTWTLTKQEPPSPPVESHLEQSFRTAFAARVTALGATVKESPGPQGNRLTITFPNATRLWTLEPQVLLTGSKPDFVLSSSQASSPPVAIFTDSALYHASVSHNRIADDAHKRQVLRDGGAIVLAITATDVQNATTGIRDVPPWLHDHVVAELMSSSISVSNDVVEAVRKGPIDLLLAWIQNPDIAGRRVLARYLPMMFAVGAEYFRLSPDDDLPRAAGLLLTGEQPQPPSDGQPNAWWWQAGPVGCLTRTTGAVMEIALIIDDRADAIASPDHADAWREWLRIANTLNLRDQPTWVTTASEALAVPAKRTARPTAGEGAVPESWRSVLGSELTEEEREFADRMARYVAFPIPVPAVGDEENGIPIDFAWRVWHVAVCLDLDDDTRRDLEAHGWHCVPADPAAVAAALSGDA